MQTTVASILQYLTPVLLVIVLFWRFFNLRRIKEHSILQAIFFYFVISIASFAVGIIIALVLQRPSYLGVSPADIEKASDFAKGVLVLCAITLLFISFVSFYIFIGLVIYVFVFSPLYAKATRFFSKQVYEKMTWKDFFIKHNQWFHFKFYIFDKYDAEYPDTAKYSVILIMPFVIGILMLKIYFPEEYEIFVKSKVLLLQLEGVAGRAYEILFFLRIPIILIYFVIFINLKNILNCFVGSFLTPDPSIDFFRAIDNFQLNNEKTAERHYKNVHTYFKDHNFIEIPEGVIRCYYNDGIKSSPKTAYYRDKVDEMIRNAKQFKSP